MYIRSLAHAHTCTCTHTHSHVHTYTLSRTRTSNSDSALAQLSHTLPHAYLPPHPALYRVDGSPLMLTVGTEASRPLLRHKHAQNPWRPSLLPVPLTPAPSPFADPRLQRSHPSINQPTAPTLAWESGHRAQPSPQKELELFPVFGFLSTLGHAFAHRVPSLILPAKTPALCRVPLAWAAVSLLGDWPPCPSLPFSHPSSLSSAPSLALTPLKGILGTGSRDVQILGHNPIVNMKFF